MGRQWGHSEPQPGNPREECLLTARQKADYDPFAHSEPRAKPRSRSQHISADIHSELTAFAARLTTTSMVVLVTPEH
jgi:hypothetical protein